MEGETDGLVLIFTIDSIESSTRSRERNREEGSSEFSIIPLAPEHGGRIGRI
ncbi:hypothetical protein LEP1GSC047_2845 [Leptospira inadai serovar Lyme str. 10]|uniref:Uncharacterized protein n=1 Tax=Leptospira inadai serovar Lyme str. 10 TaxID=1049790 RepID=V6HCF5_9LEPT|nr:hypothetical protein LEP1GSC047_2845 [Leptospira inadai serovar Lyme str. 10]